MANIEISENLYKKVEEKIKDSEFTSVSDYVSFVLRELIDAEVDGESELTEEEEDKVKERLRSLGYLD